jgi:hypothetical protein
MAGLAGTFCIAGCVGNRFEPGTAPLGLRPQQPTRRIVEDHTPAYAVRRVADSVPLEIGAVATAHAHGVGFLVRVFVQVLRLCLDVRQAAVGLINLFAII